jgi:predicted NBD/HSP70 family sugar kinase
MQDRQILVVEIGGSGARTVFVTNGLIGELRAVPGEKLVPETLVKCIAKRATCGAEAVIVSTSGFVTPEGVIEHSTNTFFPPNLPLAKMIVEATGLTAVAIKNDMHTAAIGSSAVFPQLKGTRYNCINFGSGLGQCGCNRGEVMGLCEFGHYRMNLLDVPDARPCACGKRGCAESYIGGETLKRDAQFAAGANHAEIPKGMHPCTFLDQRYQAGDKWAVEIYERFIRAAGIYLANLQLAMPAPVYTLRGSLARKSLRIPGVMEGIKKMMDCELPAKSWMPEFLFIPPPQPSQPKDFDAFLGAGLLGEQMLAAR